MFYLPEYPGVADCSTPYHNAINTIPVAVVQRFLGAVNIAVSEDGYVYAGIIFYFGYQCPVGFTFVHLAACTSMNGKCPYAYILQTFGFFFYVFCIIVPAKACFYSYGQPGGLYHSISKANHEVNIF